jgi:hypothetical protein
MIDDSSPILAAMNWQPLGLGNRNLFCKVEFSFDGMQGK